MSPSLLPYVVAAILSAEDSGQFDVGRQGEIGVAQIKLVMLHQVEKQVGDGLVYDHAVRYSVNGSMAVIEAYLLTWHRRINGRVYTLADLSAGDCGVLWACGPGGLDRRLGRRPGPYAAKVQQAFDAQVQRVAER